jgi:hypothetical protein
MNPQLKLPCWPSARRCTEGILPRLSGQKALENRRRRFRRLLIYFVFHANVKKSTTNKLAPAQIHIAAVPLFPRFP